MNTRIITGIVFVLSAVVLVCMFRLFIESPAFRPSSDGAYGEMYGPVAFGRFIVYGLCLIQALVGVVIVWIGRGWIV
jgi:hypothetical protein